MKIKNVSIALLLGATLLLGGCGYNAMQQAEERQEREAEQERVHALRAEHRRALSELDEQIRRGEIDADVGLAVRHARELMRAGKPPGLANYQAAEVYGVEVHQVARYTGKVGASVKQARRKA